MKQSTEHAVERDNSMHKREIDAKQSEQFLRKMLACGYRIERIRLRYSNAFDAMMLRRIGFFSGSFKRNLRFFLNSKQKHALFTHFFLSD